MAELLTPTEMARFNKKFVEGRPDQCWNWTGSHIGSSGAPQFDANRRPDGSRPRYSAARAMYELRCGTVPQGTYVLPKCLNKLCVNPAHLVLSPTPRLRAESKADTAAPVTTAPFEPVPVRADFSGRTIPTAAVDLSVLASLDRVTSLDAPVIEREIAATETRLVTLRAVYQLASATGRHRAAEQVRAPAPPKPAPAPKAVPKQLTKKSAAPKSAASSRNVLARRMVYFLAAAEQPVPVATIAAAMSSTKSAVEYQLKSPWFLRNGDTVGVTDAGRTVALEGRS